MASTGGKELTKGEILKRFEIMGASWKKGGNNHYMVRFPNGNGGSAGLHRPSFGDPFIKILLGPWGIPWEAWLASKKKRIWDEFFGKNPNFWKDINIERK